MVDLYSDARIQQELAFRGGTALHKLVFPQAHQRAGQDEVLLDQRIVRPGRTLAPSRDMGARQLP